MHKWSGWCAQRAKQWNMMKNSNCARTTSIHSNSQIEAHNILLFARIQCIMADCLCVWWTPLYESMINSEITALIRVNSSMCVSLLASTIHLLRQCFIKPTHRMRLIKIIVDKLLAQYTRTPCQQIKRKKSVPAKPENNYSFQMKINTVNIVKSTMEKCALSAHTVSCRTNRIKQNAFKWDQNGFILPACIDKWRSRLTFAAAYFCGSRREKTAGENL